MLRTDSRRHPLLLALQVTALLMALALAPAAASAAPSPDLVISQVYAGGGAAGNSAFCRDFVELYNRGTSTVNLSGFSIQTALSAANFVNPTALSGSVAPGGYFVLATGGPSGGTCTATPNDNPTIGGGSLAASAGKVALASQTTVLGCGATANRCPRSGSDPVRDLVGYGAGASDFEAPPPATVGPAPSPGATMAIFRRAGGQQDTDVNSADFFVSPPNPRSGQFGAAALKITETRFEGPAGSTDEFVEVTNNATGPVSIADLNVAACNGGPTTISAPVPESTLRSGQSYLFAGGSFTGPSDQALLGDIPDGGGVRLQDSSATPNVIDSIGVAGSACAEGAGVADAGAVQHSYVRRSIGSSFVFRDTNINASDFALVATVPEAVGSTAVLGSVTAEPLADSFRLFTGATVSRFSTSAPITSAPNREILTGDPRGTNGVLRLRRTLTNTTGSTLTDLRLVITVLTTKRGDGATSQADLRLISAPGEANAGGTGLPTAATTLEPTIPCSEPPTDATPCGGVNSRVSLPGTLAPGESIGFNLDFAIERGGPFVIAFAPEASFTEPS